MRIARVNPKGANSGIDLSDMASMALACRHSRQQQAAAGSSRQQQAAAQLAIFFRQHIESCCDGHAAQHVSACAMATLRSMLAACTCNEPDTLNHR